MTPTATIAMACDRQYLYPLAVALASFVRHSSIPVSLRFGLASDWQRRLSPAERDAVLALAALLGAHAVSVETAIDVADLPPTLHISPTAFVKPAMFDAAGSGERWVWLDADMIARADWTEVLDSTPPGSVAGVPEAQPSFEMAWPAHGSGWYVNTGVVVVDADRWQHDFADTWRGYLEDYEGNRFRYLDQDVLNAAIRDSWTLLPQRFNYRLGYSGEWCDPTIVHFAGWWKPWLRVGRQVSQLTGDWAKVFREYAEAESYLDEVLLTSAEPAARRFWRAQRTRVRGLGSWRAYLHYAQGAVRGA